MSSARRWVLVAIGLAVAAPARAETFEVAYDEPHQAELGVSVTVHRGVSGDITVTMKRGDEQVETRSNPPLVFPWVELVALDALVQVHAGELAAAVTVTSAARLEKRALTTRGIAALARAEGKRRRVSFDGVVLEDPGKDPAGGGVVLVSLADLRHTGRLAVRRTARAGQDRTATTNGAPSDRARLTRRRPARGPTSRLLSPPARHPQDH